MKAGISSISKLLMVFRNNTASIVGLITGKRMFRYGFNPREPHILADSMNEESTSLSDEAIIINATGTSKTLMTQINPVNEYTLNGGAGRFNVSVRKTFIKPILGLNRNTYPMHSKGIGIRKGIITISSRRRLKGISV
jgi:hypothetical protein